MLTIVAISLLSGLLVVGWLVSAAWWGDTACEFAPGSSLYGEATVSWLPPGRTCTYTDVIPGETHVDSPEWSRLVVLGVALLGLPMAMNAQRALGAAKTEGRTG